MVKMYVKCKRCEHEGVENVTTSLRSSNKIWECPKCGRKHINEGIIS